MNKCWRILCEVHKKNIYIRWCFERGCEGLVAIFCCFNDWWFFWHKEKVKRRVACLFLLLYSSSYGKTTWLWVWWHLVFIILLGKTLPHQLRYNHFVLFWLPFWWLTEQFLSWVACVMLIFHNHFQHCFFWCAPIIETLWLSHGHMTTMHMTFSYTI
jgi:hypothetical protein